MNEAPALALALALPTHGIANPTLTLVIMGAGRSLLETVVIRKHTNWSQGGAHTFIGDALHVLLAWRSNETLVRAGV
jgi:hypothetical protein